MSAETHLLTTRQMAEFARDGFVRLDEMIPDSLCQEIIEEVKSRKNKVIWAEDDRSVFDAFGEETVLGKILRLPALRGALASLVGSEPRFDHFATHLTPARTRKAANLHQDAEYDIREHAFDVQVSIFPAETTREMGGTLFLPGSHFRRVYVSDIARYHSVVGQVQTVCPAGTVVIWHHNLWHAARSNHSDVDRYMLKLRVNPTEKQELLWDTSDLDDAESIAPLSADRGYMPWWGQEGRLEIMQRIKFWRYLTGDPHFDLASYCTRVESEPHARMARAPGVSAG